MHYRVIVIYVLCWLNVELHQDFQSPYETKLRPGGVNLLITEIRGKIRFTFDEASQAPFCCSIQFMEVIFLIGLQFPVKFDLKKFTLLCLMEFCFLPREKLLG